MIAIVSQIVTIRGSVTVWLTSWSTVLDFAKEVNLLIVLIHQNSLIQTSKTGGQPCSDNITELTHKALLNPEFSESRA